MQLPPAAAEHFRRFAFSAWVATDLPRRDMLARAGIEPRRRNSFDRSFQEGTSTLTTCEARSVIDAVAPLLRMDPDAVWQWVLGTTPAPQQLQELIISSALQPRRLPAQVHVLVDFEARAMEQIGWSIVPKLSALGEGPVQVIHKNCTLPLGARAARVFSHLNCFYKERRRARTESEQRPEKQILLHFRSDMLKFREGTGLFAGLPLDDRAQAIEDYADDTIDLHGNSVGIIDDISTHVPRELIAHFRRFEAVFVLDASFVYKVHLGGLLRTTCSSTDHCRQAFIRDERAKLHELKKYVCHGWTKKEMKNAVMSFMPA